MLPWLQSPGTRTSSVLFLHIQSIIVGRLVLQQVCGFLDGFFARGGMESIEDKGTIFSAHA